ncbi:MAG: hypothetical protein ACRBFS_25825 [Aureispira sp.]
MKTILNKVLGSKNVILNDSDENRIHVGDQNIFFDLESKTLKTKCPNCGEPADENSAGKQETYKSFRCANCKNSYYEYDEIAKNVSNYLDLNYEQSNNFNRLISAVNHDLQAGEIEYAFQRCLLHKETYGNTPEIYEWGALTLFLKSNIEDLIDSSCQKVIVYLDRALEFDHKSDSYDQITSSIATRYFKAVHKKIKAINNNIGNNQQAEHLQEKRQEIYRLILEYQTCYKINKDVHFAIKGIQELYGYNRIAWFDNKLCSIFIKPKDISTGYRRSLKGYAWDYHKIKPNCDFLFEYVTENPSELTIIFENIILENGFSDNLSEIRTGKLYDSPISVRAKIVLFALLVHGSIFLLSVILYYYQFMTYLTLLIFCYLGMYVLSHIADKDNLDEFRRIIDLEREGDFKIVISELVQRSEIKPKVTSIIEKIRNK